MYNDEKDEPDIKVIREGVLPSPLVYEGGCSNCGCQIEVTKNVQIGHAYVDCGGTPSNTWVYCPTEGCGRKIAVKTK